MLIKIFFDPVKNNIKSMYHYKNIIVSIEMQMCDGLDYLFF